MKVFYSVIIIISLFPFSGTVFAQIDSLNVKKDTELPWYKSVQKTKLSFGFGIHYFEKEYENHFRYYLVYSAEYFYTSPNYIALGGGLDVYSNDDTPFYPSISGYVLLNLNSPIKGRKLELYIGVGEEFSYFAFQSVAYARLDFNFTKSLSGGLSIKQPIGQKQSEESNNNIHMFKINFSINFF